MSSLRDRSLPSDQAIRKDANNYAHRRDAVLLEMTILYRDRLFRTAMRILGNAEDAEDAVQETFINAYTHAETFRGDSSLSTWLTRIVMNQSLMQLRKRKRRPSSSLDDKSLYHTLVSHAPPAETLLLRAEKRQLLMKAVNRLPDRLRFVTIDRLLAEKSIADIAKHHGISQAATKSRLLRARTALHSHVGGSHASGSHHDLDISSQERL